MRILIDTDPGVDDAMALLLACASPELEICGVSTVFGNNSDVPLLTRNALALLALAGRDDIPVAMGARQPLVSDSPPIGILVHGDNGLGGAEVAPSARAVAPQSAAEMIVAQAAAHSGELTLVTLAPLTNVALALGIDPLLPQRLAGVSLMGGAVTVPGNATPCAESNIYNDPEAAARLFGSGLPLTMAGLDVTRRATVDASYLDALRDLGTRCGRFLHTAAQHYLRVYLARGDEGLVMHDVHAIMVLLRPEIYTMREVRVDVECAGALTRGATVADWRGQWGRPHQTRLLVDVDAAAFRTEFL
ncbi:MAG: nucleoside hydrolase, partial [Caldilineaceae bacterium]